MPRVAEAITAWMGVTALLACSAESTTEPTIEGSTQPASVATIPIASSRTEVPPTDESLFLGEPESRILHALATEEVMSIEKGRGGRSLAFKVTLSSGVRGYFKPEQTFSAAHFYAELASYYLDRELGLGRVPPTVGRRFDWAPFRRRAGRDDRLDEIVIQGDGTVRGALIAWVEGGLEPISPPNDWTNWLRVEDPLPVSPYQRPGQWAHDRRHGPRRFPRWTSVPSKVPSRPREISDLILFDYLTTNVDRWGGDFTNVRTRGVDGPLIYLDNGAGFSAGPSARIPLMDARLEALQRFSHPTVEKIRGLDMARLRRRMERDALSPFLNERHWQHLEERRQHLLAHVEDTTRTFGADAVFPW